MRVSTNGNIDRGDRDGKGGHTGKHGYNAKKDLFDALDGTPAFGRLFVHGRIVAWGVQDRYADGAVRVNCVGGTNVGERGTEWDVGRHVLLGWNKGGSNFILNGERG
jgi:hypothetical protein